MTSKGIHAFMLMSLLHVYIHVPRLLFFLNTFKDLHYNIILSPIHFLFFAFSPNHFNFPFNRLSAFTRNPHPNSHITIQNNPFRT